MKADRRKVITEEQFESLKPFDKMAEVAEGIINVQAGCYWFQVVFEVTHDCPRHGFV